MKIVKAGGTLLFIICMAACGPSGKAPQKRPDPVVPVSVALAETREMPLLFESYGLVEAFADVSIKPQVTGKILKLEFTPGQTVSKGQTLVRLDARQFEDELKMAESANAKNTILLQDAKRLAALKERLHASGVVPEDEMLRLKAVAKAAEAALTSDKAEIERRRLDLEYCEIKAPFAGRVGDILSHEGSLVKANETAIVELTCMNPVYVAFSVPEGLLPEILPRIASGGKLTVVANLPGTQTERKGELSFVDSEVDSGSGTVKLKALFENKDRLLWPGQYLDVSMKISADTFTALPSECIQPGQDSSHIFVVKDGGSVEMREVSVSRTAEGFSGVSGNLKPGETVVMSGQFMLAPDSKVSVKETVSKAPETSKP